MNRFAATAFSLISLGITVVAQTNPSSWEMADPNVKILMGIDVRSLRESAVVQSAMKSAGDSWKAQLERQNLGSFHMPGMELLNDIDRVFISSSGERATPRAATTAAAKPVSANSNPSFLAVIEGTFPPEHYQTLLNGTKRTYRGVPVYKLSKTGDGAISVVDEHMIVIGDEKSVFSALDRRGRGTQPQSEAVARAAALASSNDFWIVIKDASSAFPSAAAAPGPGAMAAQFASQIDGLEIGTSLRDGLTMDLNLIAKTEGTTQMLAGLLSTQLQAAAAQPENPQAAELLRKVKVAAEGTRLHVSVALTKEELEQQIQYAQALRQNPSLRTRMGARAGAPSQTRSAAVAPVEAPAPAVPPGPRKIRIFGLDEGVREIPLDPASR